MLAFQYLPSSAETRRNRLRQAIGAIAKRTFSVIGGVESAVKQALSVLHLG
jgi:hypothetical protein